MQPGDAATRSVNERDGREYVYATTNLDVARAYAVLRGNSAVYRVALDTPIVWDDNFHEGSAAGCWRSQRGTIVDRVEVDVDMSHNEAVMVMAPLSIWDGPDQPMYDEQGFGLPPPIPNSSIEAEDLREQLRSLGTYPNPRDIQRLATQLCGESARRK